MIGEVMLNSRGLEFKVVSKDNKRTDVNHSYYNIEFIKTGYKTSVRLDTMKDGLVRDKLEKSCCGIGMIGYINTSQHIHEYKIWKNMFYRCYCESDKSYKYYGEKGVIVCDRWHRFDYFVKDIKNLQGFNQDLFDAYKLRLDKDILSKDNKIYSPETTMWVSDLVNQKIRTYEYNSRNKKFAIFPDGKIEQIFHVTDFCKKHGLHRQNVNLCLAGKQKATKGFQFYKE